MIIKTLNVPQDVPGEDWQLKAFLYGDRQSADRKNSGGLVLANIRHSAFSMAQEIRVVGIWVGSKQEPEKYLCLGSSDLPLVADSINYQVKPKEGVTSDIKLLANYPRALEIHTDFATPGPVLGNVDESQPLQIKQTYILTKYAQKPAHEPLGGLPAAARLYPMIKFSYQGKAKESKPLKYIRVDYRIEVRLEPHMFTYPDPNIARNQGKYILKYDPNAPNLQQALVMQDLDDLPSAASVAWTALKHGATSDPEHVFAFGDKPIRKEMIGEGFTHSTKGKWDNIHIWGKMIPEEHPLSKKVFPTTPGMPHGFHIHWRWGAVIIKPVPFFSPIDPLKPVEAQFFGADRWGNTELPGGILLDYKIPDQSIRFAITEYKGSWDSTINPSEKEFDQLFTPYTPKSIEKGVPVIVVWLSNEIFRDHDNANKNKKWEGTTLQNGLYFGHEVLDLNIIHSSGKLFTEPIHKPGTRSGPKGWFNP